MAILSFYALAALDPAWIALIGTILATIGLAVVNRFLNDGSAKRADSAGIRGELRQMVVDNREHIKYLEEQANQWQRDLYELRMKYEEVSTEIEIIKRK